MSAAASFLQRVVVAAAGAAPPARTAPAARGPLTLGQFLRRRRPIFFRSAMTLARETAEELEEEAAPEPASSAPPPADSVHRSPLVRRSVSGLGETAAGTQTAAETAAGSATAARAQTGAPPPSQPELRGSPEIARLADAGSRPARAHDPAGNSIRHRAPDSAPADAPGRAAPGSRAEVTPPSQRPAAADSLISVHELHSAPAAGGAVELPGVKLAPDVMALPPGKEIFTVPAYPAPSATASAPAAPFHLSAEAQGPLPAAAGVDQAPGSSAVLVAPATQVSGARSRQAAGAPPAIREEPALLLPGALYADATPPSRQPANEARTAEPVVQIGTIEIIIEAAAEPRAPGVLAAASAQDFASRFYLRGL